ncbi:hypothetical protein KY334_02710 [Candidatus Woesearchaeota archaeon]|nr:hypothetical protein [Candidatus Woesearchaeota archaeon]
MNLQSVLSSFIKEKRKEGKEELIHSEEFKGTKIRIYHHSKKQTFICHGHDLDFILFIIKNLSDLNKFKEIEIVFHLDKRLIEERDEEYQSVVRMVNQDGRSGYINKYDIREGKYRIHINEDYLLLYSSQKKDTTKEIREFMYYELKRILEHEIVHLWHFRVNHVEEIMEKNAHKLSNAIYKIKNQKLRSWKKIRIFLLELIQLIVYEGAAKYSEMFKKGVPLNEKSAKAVYKNSENLAKKLQNNFNEVYKPLIEGKNLIGAEIYWLKEDSKDIPYDLGMHIYHYILTFTDYTFEELCELKYNKLIKLYEKTCDDQNIKPLVSLNSKKGVFDFSKNVQKLHEIRRNKNKLKKAS